MTTPVPAPMPTLAADTLRALEDELTGVNDRQVADTTNGGAAALHRNLGDQLVEALEALQKFTGPGVTAPLLEVARKVSPRLNSLEERTALLEREVQRTSLQAIRRRDLIGQAFAATADLGRRYVERDREAIEAELLVVELEQIIEDSVAETGTRRLTRGMAASRIREARKRAARRTDELLADEVVDAVIVED